MQLIQQVAACKRYDFSGWFLAEASLCLEGKACSFSLEVCRKTARRAVLQVLGWDEDGRCRQSLTVLLVKPLDLPGKAVSVGAGSIVSDGEALWRHVFSDEEIQAYLAVSGDSNEIHRGKDAVVPGLCFLERLLSSLALQISKARICRRGALSRGDACRYERICRRPLGQYDRTITA